MIACEGRVLAGVDEFMLRLGHLTVTCLVAQEADGNRYRLEQYLGEHLTAPTVVPLDAAPQVAEYLIAKGLVSDGGKAGEAVRYPELVVKESDGKHLLEDRRGGPPTIWWQDLQLARPEVRSKVGGVTVRAKSGSKSALSHILDWATFLELLSPAGDLTPWGKLLAGVAKTQDSPYAITDERVVLAWLVFQADLDVIARLSVKIAASNDVIGKREATALFVQSIEQLEDEVRDSRTIRRSHADVVYAAHQDLIRASNRSGRPIASTSTAWHRASNRFETLVDLGFLSKPDRNAGQYSYQYERTGRLIEFARSFTSNVEAREWFDLNFSGLVSVPGKQIESDFIESSISDALALMQVKSTLVPIDTLLISLLVLAKRAGKCAQVGDLRKMLLEFVRANPEVARLSAGRYGRDAEFVSLRVKK